LGSFSLLALDLAIYLQHVMFHSARLGGIVSPGREPEMAFILRRRAASRRQRGADLPQEEASGLLGSPGERTHALPRGRERGGVSALAVIVALLILIAVLGLMLASGI
jgi:hypothetical protein